MSQIFRQTRVVAPEEGDEAGILRPSMILRYAQDVAGAHCELLQVTQDALDEKGIFWAIIRNQLTVDRLPRVGQTVTLETWPMPTTRTCFPRATVCRDEQGNRLFACHSLWILMDQQTRAMLLPGKSGVDVPGIMLEDTPPAPRSLSPIQEDAGCLRTVSAADLDRNGHMNNARYLDWVTEVAPGAKGLKCATLCYLNEAKLGQNLQICWKTGGESCLNLDIRRPKEDGEFDRIFSASLEFDQVVM